MGCSCRLVRCCCCCTVETGSVIIGTLGWVYTLVSLFGFIGTDQISTSGTQTGKGNATEVLLDSMLSQSLGGRIGYAVIDLIICALLVWGIYKKDHRFMIPYLIMQCIKCVTISIIAVVLLVIIFFVSSKYIALAVFGIIFFFITSVLFWYFWLCVWSHYMDLKERGPHSTVYYSPTTGLPPNEKDRQQTV